MQIANFCRIPKEYLEKTYEERSLLKHEELERFQRVMAGRIQIDHKNQ